jgi:hypothetical protein
MRMPGTLFVLVALGLLWLVARPVRDAEPGAAGATTRTAPTTPPSERHAPFALRVDRRPTAPPRRASPPRRFLPDALVTDDESAWVVATPACGSSERRLTLPERRAFAPDEHDVVVSVLEDARQQLAERLGAGGGDDDDARRLGGLLDLARRWNALPVADRRVLLALLRDGTASADPLIGDIRRVDQINAELMQSLSDVTGGDAPPLSELSWCAIVLRADA